MAGVIIPGGMGRRPDSRAVPSRGPPRGFAFASRFPARIPKPEKEAQMLKIQFSLTLDGKRLAEVLVGAFIALAAKIGWL